jgi:hypothetical protein
MTSINKLDDTTTAVSNGKAVLILKDFDKDGKVDAIALGSQTKGSEVYFGDLRGDKVILAGEWGDPHVAQKSFTDSALGTLKGSMNNVLADATDGTLNNAALLDTAVNQALNGGVHSEVMDLHADHVLKNGSNTAKVDVEAVGNVAYAENAVFSFGDGKEYAIRNMWNRTGNDGDISVGLAVAGEGGQSKGTFVTIDEKTMGHADSTRAFGAAYGSVGKYVLDVAGNFHGEYGAVGKFMDKFDDYAATGLFLTAFNKKRKDDDKAATTAPAAVTAETAVK